MIKRHKIYKSGFLINTTNDIVGSDIALGIGSTTIGSFEGMPGVPSNLTKNIIVNSSNMMGTVIPTTYGIGVMNMFSQNIPKKNKK